MRVPHVPLPSFPSSPPPALRSGLRPRTSLPLLLLALLTLVLGFAIAPAQATGAKAAADPDFKVIAFYNGTFDAAHISFVKEANEWFPKAATENNFSYTSTNDWSRLNADELKKYDVVLFLDDAPPTADERTAFEQYMKGGGAWMGFHASAYTDDPDSWSWYHNDFLGTGAFKNNTWEPTTATLRTDDRSHASTANLPATFTSSVSEWYSWNKDLRQNPDIDILASVDPSSFPLGTDPNQSWTDGYYPILWTNKKYRMLYANFGHNKMNYDTNETLSHTFSDETQNHFVLDGLRWLGTGKGSAGKAVAGKESAGEGGHGTGRIASPAHP